MLGEIYGPLPTKADRWPALVFLFLVHLLRFKDQPKT